MIGFLIIDKVIDFRISSNDDSITCCVTPKACFNKTSCKCFLLQLTSQFVNRYAFHAQQVHKSPN